jgi:hypothetical protein
MGSTMRRATGVRAGSDRAMNEFLRGVIWNDDPAVLMCDENLKNNWDFSGASWKSTVQQGWQSAHKRFHEPDRALALFRPAISARNGRETSLEGTVFKLAATATPADAGI